MAKRVAEPRRRSATALAFAAFAAAAVPSQAADDGATLFRLKCAACHSVACNRQGPRLEGVFGRRAGDVADFRLYTSELKASGIVWTDQTLDAYLRDPNALVPGTSMAAWGRVDSADERGQIIAHMRREDRSADLCPR